MSYSCLGFVALAGVCLVLLAASMQAADAPGQPAVSRPGSQPASQAALVPPGYFDEPAGLPFDEEIQDKGQEDGWHWMEFRYTSIVYDGEPIRVHAVYAVPDSADAQHKAPAILMTHGIFGAVRGKDARYWAALSACVKAGYAVLFFDWYPNFAHDFKPTEPNEPKRFTTFGKLDYFTPYYDYNKLGNDRRDSLQYQVAMAGKRGVTWLTARPEVDGKKIGVTGASYGGVFSAMLAGLDERIVAANPCCYTGGFGPKEYGYNALGFTGEALAAWQARFDPQTLLANRKVEVLYMIGANDPVFRVTKAMDNFAAMKGPKHLLMGPNEGHEYWPPAQTVLFFDAAMKGNIRRPAVSDLEVLTGCEYPGIGLSVQAVGDEPLKVEFFPAQVFELDPDKPASTILPDKWKWQAVPAHELRKGAFSATWNPPPMRPAVENERLYRWTGDEPLDPKNPPASQPTSRELLQGQLRVFARVTDAHGAMECTPVSAAIPIEDPPAKAAAQGSDAAGTAATLAGKMPAPLKAAGAKHSLPALEGGIRVATPTAVEINTGVPAGKPMAVFPAGLPTREVGRCGYYMWFWRQKDASADLTTDGAATPTKKVLPPFVDTVTAQSFTGGRPWPQLCTGGLVSFTINGKAEQPDKNGRAWHGAVPIVSGIEEIALEAKDDQEHRVTLVMAASGTKESCNVRVSLIGQEDAGKVGAAPTETVQYRQTPTADAVIQFRFRGKATLCVAVTARPEALNVTQVGPTAIFFD